MESILAGNRASGAFAIDGMSRKKAVLGYYRNKASLRAPVTSGISMRTNCWGVTMRSTRSIVIRRLLLACACGIAPIAGWANDIAQFKVAKGAVHVERSGQRLHARVGTHLQATDTVVTGADGAAGIAFVDNSLLSVGPNSVLVIERYAFNSTTYEGAFESSLRKGTLSVVSGKIAKQSPDAMKVKTPSSILGVRGTEFLVRSGD